MVGTITWAALDKNGNCFLETTEFIPSVKIFQEKSSEELLPLIERINREKNPKGRELLLISLARVCVEAYNTIKSDPEKQKIIKKTANLLLNLNRIDDSIFCLFVISKISHYEFIGGRDFHALLLEALAENHPGTIAKLIKPHYQDIAKKRKMDLPAEPGKPSKDDLEMAMKLIIQLGKGTNFKSAAKIEGPKMEILLHGRSPSTEDAFWGGVRYSLHISIGDFHYSEKTRYFITENIARFKEAGVNLCVVEGIRQEAQPVLDELFKRRQKEGKIEKIDGQELLRQISSLEHDPRLASAQYDLILALINGGIRVVAGEPPENELKGLDEKIILEYRNRYLARLVDEILRPSEAKVLVAFGGAHNNLGEEGYVQFLNTEREKRIFRVDVLDKNLSEWELGIAQLKWTRRLLGKGSELYPICENQYGPIPKEKHFHLFGSKEADHVVVLCSNFSPFPD